MPTDQGRGTDELPLRVLTCEELDERIQGLAGMIASQADGDITPAGPSSRDRLDPRWISSAELVRLVRPFLVYN